MAIRIGWGVPWLGALLVVALLAGRVDAQPSPAAEKLFRDGRALLKEGKLSEACEAFAASARIEPSIGALLNLGDCRAKLRQTAQAWAAFTEAARLAKRQGDDRAAEAKRRADELEGKLSYLTIKVTPNVRDVEVARDGELVDPATFGVALPVDPGLHEIRARAPGYAEWTRRTTIRGNGDRQTIVIELDKQSGDGKPREPLAPDQAREPAPREVDEESEELPRSRSTSPLRTAGIVIGLGGVAGIGVSTWLALSASSLYGEARDVCPEGQLCLDRDASDKSKRAASRADLATIVGGIGVAAVATGVVLWIVGKPARRAPLESEARIVPLVAPDAIGVGLAGTLP